MDVCEKESVILVAGPTLIETGDAEPQADETGETIVEPVALIDTGNYDELHEDELPPAPPGGFMVKPELRKMYVRALARPLSLIIFAPLATLMVNNNVFQTFLAEFPSDIVREQQLQFCNNWYVDAAALVMILPSIVSLRRIRKRFIRASRILDLPARFWAAVQLLPGETNEMSMRIGDRFETVKLRYRQGPGLALTTESEAGRMVTGPAADDPILVRSATRWLWLERRKGASKPARNQRSVNDSLAKTLAVVICGLFLLMLWSFEKGPQWSVYSWRLVTLLISSVFFHISVAGTAGKGALLDTILISTLTVLVGALLSAIMGVTGFFCAAALLMALLRWTHKLSFGSICGQVLIFIFIFSIYHMQL